MPQDLVAAFLRRRSRRRFTAVVRAHRDDILGAAYRILADRDAAEDVTQEVLLKLLTARWKADQIRSGKGLLLSSAVLAALARARAEGRRARREEAVARRRADLAVDGVARADAILDVRDAVLDLPEGLRAAVELRYWGGLTVREVAVTLGSPVDTVKDRLERARNLLRDRLGPPALAIALEGLSAADGAALPTIAPSAQLLRELRHLSRSGVAMAAIAAGGATAGTAPMTLALAGVAAAVALVALVLRVAEEAEPAKARESAASTVIAEIRPATASGATPLAAALPGAGGEPATPAASPERAYRLADDSRSPIAGARLVFTRTFLDDEPVPESVADGELREREGEWAFVWVTLTSADGGFDLPSFTRPDQPLDGLHLHASKAGYITRRWGFQNVPPPRGNTFVLGSAPEVELRVLDPGGALVPRYHLRLDQNLGDRDELLTLDDPARHAVDEIDVEAPDGVHRFRPRSWRWHLGATIEAIGFPPLSGRHFTPDTARGAPDLVVRLASERKLRGAVLGPAGAVAGTRVWAGNARFPVRIDFDDGFWRIPGSYASGTGAHVVECDATGSFEIAALPADTWLVASHPDFVPTWLHVRANGDDAEPIVMRLDVSGAFEARCLDAGDGPVSDTTVEVRLLGDADAAAPAIVDGDDLQQARPVEATLRARTDAEGCALFPALPPGTWVWFETREPFTVRAGETTALVDRAPRAASTDAVVKGVLGGATLSGRLTVYGEPLRTSTRSNPAVIANRHVSTDAEGRYELRGLPAGDFYAEPPFVLAEALVAANVPFRIAPEDREAEFSWNWPICRFRIRVVDDATGAGVEGARVFICLRPTYGAEPGPENDFDPWDEATTLSDGVAETNLKFSTGWYALVCRAPGCTLAWTELEIGQSAPETIDVEIRTTPATSRVTMRVVAAESGELITEPVKVYLVGDGLLPFIPNDWVRGGRIAQGGLSPGLYKATADPRGARDGFLAYAEATVRMPESGGDVELTLALPMGGKLAVLVREEPRRRFASPCPRVRLRRLDDVQALPPRYRHLDGIEVDRSGRLLCEGLLPGRYEVRVAHAELAPALVEVEVEPGRTAVAELVVEAGGRAR